MTITAWTLFLLMTLGKGGGLERIQTFETEQECKEAMKVADDAASFGWVASGEYYCLPSKMERQ